MNKMMDKAQLAEMLGVPVSWVTKAITARTLPITWVGRYARFDPDDIKAWLASNKSMPESLRRGK
ncbi:helix-turn-helix domain-containing protein [Micromonospora sp. NPDC047738]|uniref:helix-turn-helix domain-containing protein n=1 Tax=Micromonospora sp. NPDC047738 TaxID=3155741 RepID=UPI0033F24B20